MKLNYLPGPHETFEIKVYSKVTELLTIHRV
jgi:hypothetical protein